MFSTVPLKRIGLLVCLLTVFWCPIGHAFYFDNDKAQLRGGQHWYRLEEIKTDVLDAETYLDLSSLESNWERGKECPSTYEATYRIRQIIFHGDMLEVSLLKQIRIDRKTNQVQERILQQKIYYPNQTRVSESEAWYSQKEQNPGYEEAFHILGIEARKRQ